MYIKINGKDQELSGACTLEELVVNKNLMRNTIVIEQNGLIIPKKQWGRAAIGEGDVIEIIGFVGGG
jgi:sulfur carrier protein